MDFSAIAIAEYIQKMLFVFYIILCILYLVYGHYVKSMYWAGASLLSIGVLLMK